MPRLLNEGTEEIMKHEIKDGVVIFSVGQDLTDNYAARFLEELKPLAGSKYLNYIIDISADVKLKSIKMPVILISLASFCGRNGGRVAVSTRNRELIASLDILRISDRFLRAEDPEPAFRFFSKQ